MTGFLLFIKHRVPVVWQLVERLNSLLFRLLHDGRLQLEAERAFGEFTLSGYRFRAIEESDLPALHDLLHRQRVGRLDFFKPHGFDGPSLARALRNPAFLMFGVFAEEDEELVGYFFLRCFWNRRAFVGRLIDEPHERKGIGRVMNDILYHTAWRSRFRCLTTISKSNKLVMRSHANNPTVKVLEELPNEYLCVEFIPPPGADLNSSRGRGPS